VVMHMLYTKQLLNVGFPTTVSTARTVGRDLDVACPPHVVYLTDTEHLLSNNGVIFAIIARVIGRDLNVECHPHVVY